MAGGCQHRCDRDARLHPSPSENIVNVILDGRDRHGQSPRNLRIGESARDQQRDVALAWGEPSEQCAPFAVRDDTNDESCSIAVVVQGDSNVGIRPQGSGELVELRAGERGPSLRASFVDGIAKTAQHFLVDMRRRGLIMDALHSCRVAWFVIGPALLLFSLLSAAPSARAQGLGTADGKRAVIDSLASLLRAQYVDADTGALIAAHLSARQHAGAYDSLPPKEFAAQVTRDLRATNGDKHLSLVLRDPATSSGPAPVLSGPFLGPVEMRSGNIGLLTIRQVSPPSPDNLRAVDDAMRSFEHAHAMVIDLRGNRGGAGAMNDYLWGFFIQPDSVPTMQALTRGTSAIVQRWAKRIDKPGPPRDAPLFILVNSSTGSAAEGLAFYLQQSGRATVIGEPSAGAGHGVAFFSVAPGVVAGVSITRVWYPPTGKEWERTGVIPNVATSSDVALDTAIAMASRTRPKARSVD